MSLFDRKPRGRETLERRNGPREETVTVGQPLDAKERGQTTYYELKTRIHGQLIERLGKLDRTRVTSRDETHLWQVIDRVVSAVGRRVDESSPMVDARLPDGSRVNAIIPPLALDGPVLSIRRFAKDPLRMADLIEFGTITPALAEILRATVQARLNILL